MLKRKKVLFLFIIMNIGNVSHAWYSGSYVSGGFVYGISSYSLEQYSSVTRNSKINATDDFSEGLKFQEDNPGTSNPDGINSANNNISYIPGYAPNLVTDNDGFKSTNGNECTITTGSDTVTGRGNITTNYQGYISDCILIYNQSISNQVSGESTKLSGAQFFQNTYTNQLTNAGITIATGYRYQNSTRFEGQFEILSLSNDEFNGTTVNMLLNFAYDFKTVNRARPYVFAGAGLSILAANLENSDQFVLVGGVINYGAGYSFLRPNKKEIDIYIKGVINATSGTVPLKQYTEEYACVGADCKTFTNKEVGTMYNKPIYRTQTETILLSYDESSANIKFNPGISIGVTFRSFN